MFAYLLFNLLFKIFLNNKELELGREILFYLRNVCTFSAFRLFFFLISHFYQFIFAQEDTKLFI